MSKSTVTAASLRIRSGPGLTFSIIGGLYKNDVVEGSEINGDWVHSTTSNNMIGWSHRSYLELMNETPPPPSATDVQMFVTTDTLNYRSGPGEGYPITGQIHRDEMVIYLNASADRQWLIHGGVGAKPAIRPSAARQPKRRGLDFGLSQKVCVEL